MVKVIKKYERIVSKELFNLLNMGEQSDSLMDWPKINAGIQDRLIDQRPMPMKSTSKP